MSKHTPGDKYYGESERYNIYYKQALAEAMIDGSSVMTFNEWRKQNESAKRGESDAMEKNKFNLPFSLGNAAGYNGCNIYDINSEYVCGLILPLHQTIQQIRKDAKTDLRTARNLELADYMINACNSHAALLAACKRAKTMIKQLQWDNLGEPSEFGICNSCFQRDYEGHKSDCERQQTIESIKSAIEQAGESGE